MCAWILLNRQQQFPQNPWRACLRLDSWSQIFQPTIPNWNHPTFFLDSICFFHINLPSPWSPLSIDCPLKVHNRLEYLQQFILSLSKVGSSRSKIFENNLFACFNQVKGVENVLVVFSHDVWDESINEAVRWYLSRGRCKRENLKKKKKHVTLGGWGIRLGWVDQWNRQVILDEWYDLTEVQVKVENLTIEYKMYDYTSSYHT